MQGDLPAQPRLADGLELVIGPDEMLQLRGCTPPLRLTGKMPHALLPLLDGTRSLEAITAALDGWPPNEVLAAIGALAEHGLVWDAATAGGKPQATANVRKQAAFYWAASSGGADRGEQTCQAFRNARLHLFGWGGLVQEMARALRRCGSTGLTAQAWLPPPGVLQSSPAEESPLPLLPFPTPDHLKQQVPSRSASDLVILALPRPAPALLAAANEAILTQGVPFMPVIITGAEAIIGPTVLPGRSACYECFKQRLKSNASNPDDDAAYEAYLDEAASGLTLPEWPPFTVAVASLAAMEAVRLTTRFTPPLTAGQALFVDALTGDQRFSRVWKLPRCPACLRAHRGEGGGDPDERQGDTRS